ncbi:hypothetical protein D3C78_1292020 [compost metagenome]
MLQRSIDARTPHAEQIADVSLRHVYVEPAIIGVLASSQCRKQMQLSRESCLQRHGRIDDHALLLQARAVGHLQFQRVADRGMARTQCPKGGTRNDQQTGRRRTRDQVTEVRQVVAQAHHAGQFAGLQVAQQKAPATLLRHADFEHALDDQAQVVERIAALHQQFALAQIEHMSSRNQLINGAARAIPKSQRLAQQRGGNQFSGGLGIRLGEVVMCNRLSRHMSPLI